MLNALGSRMQRTLQAEGALKRARQRGEQSPSEFLDYLRPLWEELDMIGATEEQRRVRNYINCLQEDVKLFLSALDEEQINTVAKVQEKATNFWLTSRPRKNSSFTQERQKSGEKRRTDPGEPERPPKRGNYRGRGRGGRQGSNLARNGARDTKFERTCYHCNIKGHLSPDCPTRDQPAAVDSVEAKNRTSTFNGSGKGRGRR